MYASPSPSSPCQPPLGLATLLDTINSTGCTVVTCDGTFDFLAVNDGVEDRSTFRKSHIKILRINSPLLYAPTMIAFTRSTLCSAPLQELTLTPTLMGPAQWFELLEAVSIPTLSVLEVAATCPTEALVHFLARHRVCRLRVIELEHPHHPPSPEAKYQRYRASISSLTQLDAPSSIITTLAHYAHFLTPLEDLHVRIQLVEEVNFLSELLSCTQHFPDLNSLQITLPSGAEPKAFALRNGTSVCTAQDVSIRLASHTVAPDIIVSNSSLFLLRVILMTLSFGHPVTLLLVDDSIRPSESSLDIHV